VVEEVVMVERGGCYGGERNRHVRKEKREKKWIFFMIFV
jgi:hypothetical protein